MPASNLPSWGGEQRPGAQAVWQDTGTGTWPHGGGLETAVTWLVVTRILSPMSSWALRISKTQCGSPGEATAVLGRQEGGEEVLCKAQLHPWVLLPADQGLWFLLSCDWGTWPAMQQSLSCFHRCPWRGLGSWWPAQPRPGRSGLSSGQNTQDPGGRE